MARGDLSRTMLVPNELDLELALGLAQGARRINFHHTDELELFSIDKISRRLEYVIGSFSTETT